MSEQRPSKERVGQLIDYWTAKSKSHERWPEGQGLAAEALARMYADTISTLRAVVEPPEVQNRLSALNRCVDNIRELCEDERANVPFLSVILDEIAIVGPMYERPADEPPAVLPDGWFRIGADGLEHPIQRFALRSGEDPARAVQDAFPGQRVFFRPSQPQPRKCHANMHSDPPQDCDAPFCGCNPAWDDCIQMLQECGLLIDRNAPRTAEPPRVSGEDFNDTAVAELMRRWLRVEPGLSAVTQFQKEMAATLTRAAEASETKSADLYTAVENAVRKADADLADVIRAAGETSGDRNG